MIVHYLQGENLSLIIKQVSASKQTSISTNIVYIYLYYSPNPLLLLHFNIMAKKRDDKGRSKRRPNKVEESDDSDSALNDTASVNSYCSSSRAENEETNNGKKDTPVNQDDLEDDSDIDPINDFESKFDLVLDYLQSSKSGKSRQMHYESLSKALTTRFCLDLLDNRRITIQDILEHGLKRSDDEVGHAAHLLSLVLITMGTSDYCDEIFRELFALLNRTLMDTTANPIVRSKCAIALSLGCFITDYGMEKTRQILNQLLLVGFTTVKGHPDQNQLNSIHSMKATCLDMFSFLVSIESDAFMVDSLMENIDQLASSLDSPNLVMRVAAGECIALLMEKYYELDDDYQLDQLNSICDKLQKLATDSQKSRSKKVLREQRSNFRQILRTVEGDEFGEEIIKIGQESVRIECWQSKRYYDTFCLVLASGTNLHLTQNVLLRDIFDLGPVVIDNGKVRKISKFEKNFINNYNRKAREINRGKQRGKRADYDL